MSRHPDAEARGPVRGFSKGSGVVATVALGLAVMLVGPTTAEAQGWLADRTRTEGPGIRAGDLEIHPGVGIEVGYDSNLYYTSDTVAPGFPGRVDSAILRVTPHILVSTRGVARRAGGEGDEGEAQPSVTFRGGVWGSYYEFFADERRRNVSLDAGLRLNILPGRTVSFSLFDDFSRGIRPFTDNTTETSTARDQNRAGVDVLFQSDGGIFQVRTGYKFGLDYFEGEEFRYGNTFAHSVELQETFRFLPQTGIVHLTTIGFRDYFETGVVTPTAVQDNVTVSSSIGLNGAITPEVSLVAMVGYTGGFYDSRIAGYDQDYESATGSLQVTWRLMENAQLVAGYNRSFQPSFIGNYFSLDRGHLGFQATFAGSFMFGATAGAGFVDFGQIVDATGMPVGADSRGMPLTNRQDVRVDANLFGEYRFNEWLGLNATVTYLGDFTDFQYSVPIGAGRVLDPAGYNKVEAWLGVRAFY